MPNWCSNHVTFTGKTENLKAFLLEMNIQSHNNTLDVFKLYEGNEQYAFNLSGTDISTEGVKEFDSDSFILTYDTRWSPNVNDLKQIAKHYQLDFTSEHEESGMDIFGKTQYLHTTDQYRNRFLTENEIESCRDNDGDILYEEIENLLNSLPYE